MDLPVRALLSGIRDFCIFYFKDIKHAKDAPPHFYVVFPVKGGSGIIFIIITSQVERQTAYYKRANAKAIRSLVSVDKNAFPFLKKEKSVIDCNQAELITKEELTKRIDSNFPCRRKPQSVPPNLKADINSAIIQSPLIAPAIKRLIKDRVVSD